MRHPLRHHDYLGRRVEKQVFAWDPDAGGGAGAWETQPETHRKFVWYNWLMLLELDGLNGDNLVRKYAWGLDVSGQSRDREERTCCNPPAASAASSL